MNKKLFTLVYILIFLTTISVSAAVNLPTNTNIPGGVANLQPATTPGSSITPTAPEQQKTLVQMLFTSKDCNYVKDKQYQPFSGIDTSFPGIGSSLTKSKQNPNVTCVNVSNATEDIVKMLFTVGITVIIMLTVISIAVSGIQYMTEEAVGKKGAAKKRLTNSFIALGLGLLSYTILYTVNKKLVEFDFNPSEIDVDKSIQKGINQVLTVATSSWVGNISGIDAVLNQNPGWSFPSGGLPTTPGSITNPNNPFSGGIPTAGFGSGSINTLAAQRINQEALDMLGTKTCNYTGTSGGALACAFVVNDIINKALGMPITRDEDTYGKSTIDMNNALSSSIYFCMVSQDPSAATPGDIIISPTVGTNHGHVGIYTSTGKIVSNSSSQAMVDDHFTPQSWFSYYNLQKRLQTYVYRSCQKV